MLFLDIETFSSVDLKKAGVYAYAESPDFEILMCGWSMNDGPVIVETEPEAIAQIPGLMDPKVPKVAHNAPFERICFSKWSGMGPGQYLPPEDWVDTMVLAAEQGLPQGLNDLAKALGVTEKDSAGTRLINLFSKIYRGTRVRPEDRPEEWAQYIEYGRQDVETLIEVFHKLDGWPTSEERQIYLLDQKINDRGMQADLELANQCISADRFNRGQAAAELESVLGIENSASVQQVTGALEARGVSMPNLRAETVSRKLSELDLVPEARKALELRQELALVASRKYEAVVNSAGPDGRVRGQFRFFGAHTGRWSGRGVQLQNLPRITVPLLPFDADTLSEMENDGEAKAEIEAFKQQATDRATRVAILDLWMGHGANPKELKALIRALFTGPLVVADYAAIEARVLAWVANEVWALEAFAEGRDIYVETALRMGGLTRQQGKVAVLALGYQGGSNSLFHMGATGSEEELEAQKVQWRRANRMIVKLWSDLNNAFDSGGKAGNLEVRQVGDHRHLILPSGRPIVYRNVRWERWVVIDPETGAKKRKEGWRFDGGRGRADTYGGRLTENAVQAISRDLLAHGMLNLENNGFQTVGHVHDEVIVEAEAHWADRITELICEAPDWAKGLPLDAEGFACDRYRKG